MLQSQSRSRKDTIWSPISEETFLQNVKRALVACGNTLGDPKVFKRQLGLTPNAETSSHTLPLDVEHQLADDLAFIAAAKEGAKAVSAVTISEDKKPAGMTIRVSANSGVSPEIQAALHDIGNELQQRSRKGIHCAGNVRRQAYPLKLDRYLLQ